MPTFQQILKHRTSFIRRQRNKTPALRNKPQRKATCLKLLTMSPRKPNSAVRKVARVRYRVIRKGKPSFATTFAYIPGEGHSLKEHAVVLFRGGRTQDLPGLKYKLIRGILDFRGLPARTNARSKYGARKPA